MINFNIQPSDKPAFLRITNVNIDGKVSKRLLIVLRTNGCTYNICTMCGFNQHTSKTSAITSDNLIEQFIRSVENTDFAKNDIEQIDILTPGSFLDDREVNQEFRIKAMCMISKIPQIRKILIESRCEFINYNKLNILSNIIRKDQIIELAIGVESSNDYVRNKILKKGLEWQHLEKIIEICYRNNMEFQSYLLIKPPTLSESEAINDSVKSAKDVAALANKHNVPFRIAFQPVFITRNTLLERKYNAGEYNLLNLWSVIEVIKRTYHIGIIFVGLSDESLSDNRKPESCPLCTKKNYNAIEEFNGNQDIKIFNSLSCTCKVLWEKNILVERA